MAIISPFRYNLCNFPFDITRLRLVGIREMWYTSAIMKSLHDYLCTLKNCDNRPLVRKAWKSWSSPSLRAIDNPIQHVVYVYNICMNNAKRSYVTMWTIELCNVPAESPAGKLLMDFEWGKVPKLYFLVTEYFFFIFIIIQNTTWTFLRCHVRKDAWILVLINYLESSTNKLYAMTMCQCPRDNILYVFIYIQNERKLCE